MTKIRLGVCGLGRAFSLMLPTLTQDPRFELVAAATPGTEGRQAFERDFGGRSYATMAELCADDGVDAIYIASPHQFHQEHVALAAAASKHCLLDKPIAISLDEGLAIVDAVEGNGVALVVGPCHSFDAPVAHASDLIRSGRYGAVQQIQAFNYTDFLYRPRRPEELDTTQGGGVVFSQAIHQIDVVRLLGGATIETVYAMTGNWDPARPTEGAYSALLKFAGGGYVSLTYSGYGRFDSDEMMHGYSELGLPKDPAGYGAARRGLRGLGSEAESALKRTRNLGFASSEALCEANAETHEHFGPVIVSCADADLRLFPDGVEVFADDARHFEAIAAPVIPRVEVLDAFVDAITRSGTDLKNLSLTSGTTHDARWGLASLEVALAILESASSGEVVTLQHQR